MPLESNTMYEMSFSPKELFYKFFCLKKCPVCKEKLISVNKKHDLGYKPVNQAQFKMMFNTVKHYNISFFYRCENSNLDFSPGESADWKDEGE